jgi:type I restriction enzyme, R subunit
LSCRVLLEALKTFKDQFGTLFTDADRVRRYISDDIVPKVANDRAYQNARKNSGPQNARIEHDKALLRVMSSLLNDDTELFKQYQDNESFHRWLTDTVFAMTYEPKREKQI